MQKNGLDAQHHAKQKGFATDDLVYVYAKIYKNNIEKSLKELVK